MRSFLRRSAHACLLVGLIGGVALAGGGRPAPFGPARAGGFVVNSLGDERDAALGDGVCATAAGTCTLRAAVQEANASLGPDTIYVPAGVYSLQDGERGGCFFDADLGITDDVVITGDGPENTVITGSGQRTVISVGVQITVEFVGVTVTGGSQRIGFAASGVESCGSTLNLTRVVVRNNANGPAIRSVTANDVTGSVTLRNSAVRDNASLGIDSDSRLTLIDSSVTGNTGYLGGGISARRAISLTRTLISGNTAAIEGGGIDSAGNLTVIDSAITGNRAMRYSGGGIKGDGVTLVNSTVSGNIADPNGGGIEAWTLTLTHATITGDQARDGAGISIGANLIITNSIIASNIDGGNCDRFLRVNRNRVTDRNSISSDDTCPLSGPGSRNDTDPQLGPLQDNGGPTPTHALLPGSPAIDAADPTKCPPTDQRGISRPQGAACDIGAFEAAAP
jgi:CSLREA domain-containing protein